MARCGSLSRRVPGEVAYDVCRGAAIALSDGAGLREIVRLQVAGGLGKIQSKCQSPMITSLGKGERYAAVLKPHVGHQVCGL